MLRKKKEKFQSIRSKLIVNITIATAAVVMTIAACLYFVMSSLQMKDSMRLNYELVETVGKAFENNVQVFKKQINFVTMNEDLQTLLKETPYTEIAQQERIRYIKSEIVASTLLLNEIGKVSLYDKTGTYLTSWTLDTTLENQQTVNKDTFNPIGRITAYVEDGLVYYDRAIRDLKTLDCIGYIRFIYSNAMLRANIDSVVQNETRFIAVVSGNDVITHNADHTTAFQNVLKNYDFTTAQDSTIVSIDDVGEVLVSTYECTTINWTVVCMVKHSDVVRSSETMTGVVLLFGLIAIVLGVIWQMTMAYHITNPIYQMVANVKEVAAGNYTMKTDIQTNDEMQVLGENFNEMIDRIDVLINKNLREELRYKDMQLTALQAQINPHFLYNTLECINGLAQLGRTDDVRKITVSFSNIMKSLAKGPQQISIAEEIAYIKDFLIIYKILLAEKLEYHIEVEAPCQSMQIPRMLIQPLVENAVLHGVKPCENGGVIHVVISEVYEGILISVSDTGKGMPLEILEKIKDYAKDVSSHQEKATIGIGVGSVIDRLRLVYGTNAHFSVQSDEEWGTTFEIIIKTDTITEVLL